LNAVKYISVAHEGDAQAVAAVARNHPIPGPRRRGRPTLRSGVADLTREEIVGSSLQIVRSDGLSAITVRRVADNLRVSPMALYQHFADKQSLIEAVVDAAIGEIRPPARDEMSWREWMIAQALETMVVFRAYPGVAAYVLGRGAFGLGDASMRIADGIIALLFEAGFARAEALQLYVTCFCFVAGLVHGNTELPAAIPADQFPSLAALASGPQIDLDVAEALRTLLAGARSADDIP
jgi:AcrR family transcriptional regulator